MHYYLAKLVCVVLGHTRFESCGFCMRCGDGELTPLLPEVASNVGRPCSTAFYGTISVGPHLLDERKLETTQEVEDWLFQRAESFRQADQLLICRMTTPDVESRFVGIDFDRAWMRHPKGHWMEIAEATARLGFGSRYDS